MGVTPPTPFVTSIEEDFASIEHRTHERASTFKSYSWVCTFWKNFFLAFFQQCRPGVLLLLVSLPSCLVRRPIQRRAANTSSRRASRIRNTLQILTWREKFFSKTWRHPNIFSSQWGGRRRYLKDVTNLMEHLFNVKKKIRYCFNFEGMFLACANHYILCWHCMRFIAPRLTSRTAPSWVRLFFQICK